MDTILSLLFNPDFQFGVATGAGLAAAGFIVFLALLGAYDEYDDRRRGNPLDQVEHFQRTSEELYARRPDLVPDAANDATLDLRDAYSRPRSARAELRSAPR